MTDPDGSDPMKPESWFEEPNVCGSCIAWKPDDPRDGESVAAGSCRLRSELSRVPASMAKCNIYKPRGAFRYDPGRASPRRRKNKVLSIVRIDKDGNETRTTAKVRAPRQPRAPRELDEPYEAPPIRDWTPTPVDERVQAPARAPAPATIDMGGEESGPVMRQALVQMVRQEHGRTKRELHDKFARGGKVELYVKEGTKLRSTSAERFFAMLDRFQSAMDQLDHQLEQRKDALGADVTKELTGQVKRMRGTFTTFNAMYQHKEDQFRSK